MAIRDRILGCEYCEKIGNPTALATTRQDAILSFRGVGGRWLPGFGRPWRTRTADQRIKSPLLYQLS